MAVVLLAQVNRVAVVLGLETGNSGEPGAHPDAWLCVLPRRG